MDALSERAPLRPEAGTAREGRKYQGAADGLQAAPLTQQQMPNGAKVAAAERRVAVATFAWFVLRGLSQSRSYLVRAVRQRRRLRLHFRRLPLPSRAADA